MKMKGVLLAALSAALVVSSAVLAQQKKPIRIGLISPLSGPIASLGKSQSLLARMAVEDINAKGGVNGSPIELIIDDAQADPGQAVLLLRKHAAEGYFGSIGPMTGTQWETASPIANQIQYPAVTVNAGKPGITVRPWTLRLIHADDQSLPDGLASFMRLYPQARRAVIVADVREATSKAAADELTKLSKKYNVQIVDVVEFSTRATDMSPAALKVKAANPDVIFVSSFANTALLLAKEFTGQNIKAPVFATSMLLPGTFASTVGENGHKWYTYAFSTNEEIVDGNPQLHQSVVKRAIPRADPSLGTPFNVGNWTVTYDAVMFYADIFRRNGIDGNTDPKKAREIVKDEFTKLKTFSGVHNYRMRDTGDAYLPSVALEVDTKRGMWKIAK